MWQNHKIAVLSTYWRNRYHSFFFMTFRTTTIQCVPWVLQCKNRWYRSAFNLQLSLLYVLPVPHHFCCYTWGGLSLDPEIPVSDGRWASAGWGQLIALSHSRKRSKGRGNVRESGSRQSDVRNATDFVSQILWHLLAWQKEHWQSLM